MESLLNIFSIILVLVGLIGSLWIIMHAFNEGGVLWGLGCLFLFPLCVVYGLANFQELKTPFFMVVCGFAGRMAIVAF